MRTRPSVQEVHKVLADRSALIVHFSGAPKGAGKPRGLLYPDDLRWILQGQANGGVSCSTVIPTDSFDGKHRNATGCIGVIVDLSTEKSLCHASDHDQGSLEDDDGQRKVGCLDEPTLESVKSSIDNRACDSYNEWMVADFRCLGIFCAEPYEISADQKISKPPGMPILVMPNESIIGIKNISPAAVATEFPCFDIYGFSNEHLCKWVNGKWSLCKHSDIYNI